MSVVRRLPVLEDDLPARPRTRADCASVPRPCPFVGCRHNTFLDVNGVGEIRLNAGDKEPDEVDPALSCALDVADTGGASLHDVGALLGFTRERARQIQGQALDRARRLFGSDEPPGKTPKHDLITSRAKRRPVAPAPPEEDLDEDAAPEESAERVSFFAEDDEAVLAHVWRIYARACGFDIRSKFSKAASAWLAENPHHSFKPQLMHPKRPR